MEPASERICSRKKGGVHGKYVPLAFGLWPVAKCLRDHGDLRMLKNRPKRTFGLSPIVQASMICENVIQGETQWELPLGLF